MGIIVRVEGQEQARMQPNSPVPIGDSRFAGLEGEAYQSLGNDIFKFGQQQLEVQRENARQQGYNEIDNAVKEAMFKAETESKDDGSDYKDIANSFAQSKINDAINNYAGNDPRLQRDFSVYASKVQRSFDVDLTVNSFKKLRDFNLNTISKNGNSIANNHRSNPNDLNFLSAWQNYANYEKDLIATGGITETDLRNKRIEFGAALATQHVAGLDHLGLHKEALLFLQSNKVGEDVFTEVDPDDAFGVGLITAGERDRLISLGEDHKIPLLKQTDGKPIIPEMTQALEMLDAGVKERLIEEQMRKLKDKSGLNVADLNAKVSGLMNLMTTGAYKAEQIKEEAGKLLGDLALWDLSPDATKRAAGKIATIAALADPIEAAALTPTSQLQANLGKAQSKVEQTIRDYAKRNSNVLGGENTIEVQDQIQDGKKILGDIFGRVVKERNSDPAAFLYKHDSHLADLRRQSGDNSPASVQSLFNAMLTRQKQLDVPVKNRRLLPKDEASARANQLGALKDRALTNKEMIAAERVTGKYFNQYWNELSGYNKTVKELKSVMNLPENTREQAIDAVINLPGLKEAEKNLPEARKALIRSSVQERVLAPFRQAAGNASRNSTWVEMTNQLSENIERTVMMRVHNNPTANIKDAVKQAYNDFVLEQFLDPSVTRLSDNKSAIFVPRKVNGQDISGKDYYIRKSMLVLSRPETLSKLDIPIHGNFSSSEDFYRDLSKRVSWRNSPDLKGMVLQITDEQGQPADVTNKKGKQIYFSFEELVNRPRQEVQDSYKNVGERFNTFMSGLPLIGDKFKDTPYVPPKTKRNR